MRLFDPRQGTSRDGLQRIQGSVGTQDDVLGIETVDLSLEFQVLGLQPQRLARAVSLSLERAHAAP